MLAVSAAAQLDAGNLIRRVRVRLAFTNGVCEPSALVSLIGNTGPVGAAAPNDRCEVDFFNVPKGSYTLQISGGDFANLDAGRIDLTSSGSAEFDVQVKQSNELDRSHGLPGSHFVSTSDLGIPNRARKEFDKSNALVGKQNLMQAIQKLNRAIAIYPGYAMAYNNLGVIYSLMGDVLREREALEKAISIDDHLALAHANLGRMKLVAGDFKGAEAAFDKASTLDPTEPATLILLAYAEFKQQRFEQAIATTRRVHAMQQAHAFAHRVAARVFEQQGQGASAIAELELFLKEAPAGSSADSARQELETVKAALR
jgi:tetratricopeptide (TPR) repeat protein